MWRLHPRSVPMNGSRDHTARLTPMLGLAWGLRQAGEKTVITAYT